VHDEVIGGQVLGIREMKGTFILLAVGAGLILSLIIFQWVIIKEPQKRN